MDTPHWIWDKILDSVGAVKKVPPCAEAMDRQDNLEGKLGKQA